MIGAHLGRYHIEGILSVAGFHPLHQKFGVLDGKSVVVDILGRSANGHGTNVFTSFHCL
jgi:hypothetical protein